MCELLIDKMQSYMLIRNIYVQELAIINSPWGWIYDIYPNIRQTTFCIIELFAIRPIWNLPAL